jgi:hypothetical protein
MLKGSHQEVWEIFTLVGRSKGVFTDVMLSLSCPWIGQVWGSQSTWLASWLARLGGDFGNKEVLEKQ